MRDQLLTIAAVAVGGIMSYAATFATDRVRWRRRTSIRWDEPRLRVYTEFANTAKVIAMTASRVMAARGYAASIKPVDIDEGLTALTHAETDRSVRFEGIMLLGDTKTVLSAYELNKRLWALERLAFADVGQDVDVWRREFAGYRRARAAFYQDARSSMGVPLAQIPLDSWLAYPWTWEGQKGDDEPTPGTPLSSRAVSP